MAIIASKIVEYRRPESVTNEDAEQWEYFVAWVSPDGGSYCWLFKDFVKRQEIKGEIISTKANINKLYKNAFQTVTLIAEDLTLNEADAVADILRAKIIRRYYKDGSYDELAIVTRSYVRRQTGVRYNITLEVAEVEKTILK